MTPSERDTARSRLAQIRNVPNFSVALDSVIYGSRVVRAGEDVPGDVAVFHGTLEVGGTIHGDAVALDGRVVLHRGAHVTGDVVAIGGGVQNEGAQVDGVIRDIDGGMFGAVPWSRHVPRVMSPASRAGLVVGWLVILGIVGVAAALFARGNLEQIADRVQDDFGKSFMIGIVGQLAFLPVLVLVTVALAITIIGIIVIPFAIVALVLAIAGALALGFVTVAYITGTTVVARRTDGSALSQTLQCIAVGLAIYGAIWAIAGVPSWGGALGGLVRLAAMLVTWAAVTVGFGATILARGGTRGTFTSAIPVPASQTDELSWQTPTPITGVAAARRPTPAPRSFEP
jgi:hypothetical protein